MSNLRNDLDRTVVHWNWRGHDIGFYSEMDFIRIWLALQRLLDGEAEYESWKSNYTPLL